MKNIFEVIIIKIRQKFPLHPGFCNRLREKWPKFLIIQGLRAKMTKAYSL
ncbi:hypothetical protein OMAG_000769 [Candidatus Omnitrophus magneticus]|uniref:Uncharacterized protein n=1 Tax=Candidatus Omnitrophus magneticus TaxID=1609969 RepID=A0A0F0CVB5_9BACT|nr:hypothetical protein OMAG_000769 [Candidatus Omnitrophus magneticus]